jgi:hypothetical protein
MKPVDEAGDALWAEALALRTAWGWGRGSVPDVPGSTPILCDAVDSTGTTATP